MAKIRRYDTEEGRRFWGRIDRWLGTSPKTDASGVSKTQAQAGIEEAQPKARNGHSKQSRNPS